MKNLLSSIQLIALLILSYTLFAQSPEGMNYQAVVRNTSGEILQNATADLRFTIIEDLPTGMSVYQESFSETTNDYGLVNLVIGEGTALSGVFSDIDWSDHEYFLQVEVNTGGGFQDMGTTKFMSVPYALHAKYSDTAKVVLGNNISSVWTESGNDIYNINTGNVGIGTAAPNHKFVVNGQSSLGSESNVVTGGSSVAVGLNDTVSGYGSFAAGRFNNATANHSIAMGYQNKAIGDQSFSINRGNTASGSQSFAAGRDNVASGNQSYVVGIGNSAVSDNEFVIGQYATQYTPQGNSSDRIFAVGIGTSSNSRQDAITVLKSGNVGIGTSAPGSKLSVVRDSPSGGVMTVENIDTNGFAGTYYFSDSVNRGYVGYVGNGGWCEKNSFQIGSLSGADLKVLVSGCTSRLTIKANTGNIGIGTNDPQEKLDVNGAVKIQQNTTNPQPKTIYGNSTPIAYGFTDYFGNLGQDYGVASFTSTATGRYILTLDNPVVGDAVVVTTMWDTNNYGFINYYQSNSTTIEFRTRNGSGVDTNLGFSFVVYGTPQ